MDESGPGQGRSWEEIKPHRLCVTIASAAFPKYDRNLNTGGDNERDTGYVAVRL
jgi:predicted acyl esterase